MKVIKSQFRWNNSGYVDLPGMRKEEKGADLENETPAAPSILLAATETQAYVEDWYRQHTQELKSQSEQGNEVEMYPMPPIVLAEVEKEEES